MNKLPLDEGRINQKLKTRSTILTATKRLMHKNRKITLEDIAKEAHISRATIYRYFSNVDLLVMEASLDIRHTSAHDLKSKVEGLSMKKSISYIQSYYNTLAQKNETGFRRYLSAALTESITNKKKIRGARRVESFKRSLDPFKKKIKGSDFDKLVNLASILTGIDALIVSKDVCDLNNEESSRLLEWGLKMVLKGMDLDHL